MQIAFIFLLCKAAAGEDPRYARAHVDDILAVSILQVHVQLEQTNSSWPTSAGLAQYEHLARHVASEVFDTGVERQDKKRESSVLPTSALSSKAIVSATLVALVVAALLLLLRGLPPKQPRQIHHTLPRGVFSLLVTMYGFVFVSTEILVPSLPTMQLDLGGTQSLVSGAVQINLLMQLGKPANVALSVFFLYLCLGACLCDCVFACCCTRVFVRLRIYPGMSSMPCLRHGLRIHSAGWSAGQPLCPFVFGRVVSLFVCMFVCSLAYLFVCLFVSLFACLLAC